MRKFYYLVLTTLLVFFASFETKAQTDTEQENKATVTVSYTNDDARQALEMIFNVTQLRSIAYESVESFEVNKGDRVRFVFNTKDYVITFDGEEITSSKDNTTGHVITVTDDVTCTISATSREYGTTNVTLWTNDINGLVLREGAIDGPIVDASKIEQAGTEDYTFGSIEPNKAATLNVYTINVSSKSPKVFVSEAEGYWIEASEYGADMDHMSAFMTSEDNILRVLNHKLVNDDKLVVYLSVDGVNVTVDDVVLRDNNHKVYPLVQGYNEFMIDSGYCNEFTAAVYSDSSTEPAFSYYCDRLSVSKNKDTEQYVAGIEGDALLHIFAGHAAPAKYTVTAEIGTDAIETAKIVVDHFSEITKDNPSVTTFKGCEVAVTPGTNTYYLDGIAPEYEGETHIFNITGNHNILLGVASGISVIDADAASKFDVVTLDGRVILKDVDASAVNALPRGIYIVNGKKMIK